MCVWSWDFIFLVYLYWWDWIWSSSIIIFTSTPSRVCVYWTENVTLSEFPSCRWEKWGKCVAQANVCVQLNLNASLSHPGRQVDTSCLNLFLVKSCFLLIESREHRARELWKVQCILCSPFALCVHIAIMFNSSCYAICWNSRAEKRREEGKCNLKFQTRMHHRTQPTKHVVIAWLCIQCAGRDILLFTSSRVNGDDGECRWKEKKKVFFAFRR